MKNIEMVDLFGQYQKIENEVDRAIRDVIVKSSFIKGADVQLFENELAAYLGCGHVIACANGTDALQLALMALGLKPGDEVIVPDFTFISTVEACAIIGLKPVLADVDENTFTLDPVKAEKLITKHTKAILPVHLYGQCANMEAMVALAKKHNLFVIEDTAQAIGASYTFSDKTVAKASAMGDIGCISFFPSKNLGCFGDGGAVVTQNSQLADTIRCTANHGMKVKYHHELIGINSRLDTIQAAVLRVKLRHLERYTVARQKAASFYDKELGSIEQIRVPYRNPASTHVFHQYTITLDTSVDRDGLAAYLKEQGIPTMVYYPVPMHRQKAYQYLNCTDQGLEVSNKLSGSVLSLPMHTELDDEQLSYITEMIKKYFN